VQGCRLAWIRSRRIGVVRKRYLQTGDGTVGTTDTAGRRREDFDINVMKTPEDQLVPYAHLWRDRFVILAVVLAQLCDTLTFMPAVARVGISAEHNILVRHLYMSFGPAGPLLLKVFSIAVVLAALFWIRSRYPARLLGVALLVGCVGLVGAWSNVAFGLMT
jgi:hypothetical protein